MKMFALWDTQVVVRNAKVHGEQTQFSHSGVRGAASFCNEQGFLMENGDVLLLDWADPL